MEHLLLRSKCSIYHNILKNLTLQRHPKVLVWSKGLTYFVQYVEYPTLHSLILVVVIINLITVQLNSDKYDVFCDLTIQLKKLKKKSNFGHFRTKIPNSRGIVPKWWKKALILQIIFKMLHST